MKKKLPMLFKQQYNPKFGLTSSVQKRVVFLTSLLMLLFCLPFLGFGQSDGDMRSLKTGGGWGSAGTFEVYTLATDSWASSATAPTATTNVTIMDGVFQTSNGSGYVANNLTIGQGNAFSGTAVLTGTAVTSVTINNAGALMANPGVTFIGPNSLSALTWVKSTAYAVGDKASVGQNVYTVVTAGTSAASGGPTGTGTAITDGTVVWDYFGPLLPTAAATPTFKMVGAYYRNKGTGYTTATVTIGTSWVASTAYAAGVQRSNGGNLYTVVTAGTSDVSGGPTGTGSGITDGTVVWNYSGSVAAAHATINGGQITGIVVDNAGAGYISNGATLPGITITGDGTGASYAMQMGIDNIIISNGGNYTVAPQVIVGSVMQVGNATTTRSITVNGNLTFKSGANIVSGSGSPSIMLTLNVGGDLVAETPVSFITVVPVSISSTTINFTKAGTATISGAGSMAFKNLSVGATTTLINNGTITITGTTNYNDILGFDFTTPAVIGTLDATAHTIALTVPGGTNVTALIPTLTLRKDVTVTPLSGIAKDFTNPVTYTTTAPGGVTTQAWTVTVTAGAVVAPAAPNATAATVVAQTSFTANWDAAATATGYYLDVATDNAFTALVTGYSNKDVANVLTLSVTGLTANTPYYYRVRAYNTGGTSVSSNTITTTTLAAAPAAPVASAATTIAKTTFSANWAVSTGATGYRLDVATDAAFTSFVTGFNDKDVVNVTTFSVTGLTAATTYYYRVRAYNTGGTSTSSNAITVLSLGTGVSTLAADALKIAVSANTVNIESTNSSIVALQIVDVNGKLMVEKNIGSSSATVSTEGWSSGIYVFTIQTKDGIVTKKIGIVK